MKIAMCIVPEKLVTTPINPDLVTPAELVQLDDSGIEALPIFQCYKRSKYLSVKHSSYFHTYEHLLASYRGKVFTFVEVGVSNGGSLLMWRDYFGPQARIIGIEYNPDGKRFEADGFEIHIGNQADPDFWTKFFESVGDVDVILDDGGHTNDQQIITAHHCLPHIRDGGMLIVEDAHTSYYRDFGNPSRFSFMNYAKHIVDAINTRSPKVKASDNALNKIVQFMGFYESIVTFHVNRRACITSMQTTNEGQTFKVKDFRRHGTIKPLRILRRYAALLGFDPLKLKRYF